MPEIKERYNPDGSAETTTLWDDYQNGLSYQSSSGLSQNLPEYVRFFEGKQWKPPTKNTKNLPRPVVNIVKMICRNKKSAILATPVKLVYRAERDGVDVEKFNRFAEYIQKEIGQESLDKKAIDDGVKKGSYFYHYYWDAEAQGKDGVKEGGLRCEIIDPLSIFFSNPTELDEQKQKWILIASREDVDSVRAKCDDDVDPETIVSDECENKYGTIEQEGNRLCTVLTRYFRKDGEVYCEKATKSVIINKPFPIAPDLQAAAESLGIERKEDAPNNSLPDGDQGAQLTPNGVRANLYPVVVGNYETRENSIYGLGEVEGIIPNQKAINFHLAMSLLNAQEIAWGKYIVLPNALRNQVINNEPGQVLVDYSNTGTGIKRLTEQAIQSQPLQLIDTIMQMTRTVTGSSEVMTGEVIGANMSGAAIAQLQSQAQQPIEELKDAFWLTKEKQGRVLAQFFKLFYREKEFTYDEEVQQTGSNGQPVVDASGNPVTEEVQQTDIFNSEEYQDVDFSVVVEATAGTKATAAGDINVLDILLSKGLISLKTYFKAYPEDALTNKSEILKGVEEDENSEKAQLQAQNAQIAQQLEQSLTVIQRQKETVDKVVSVIQENNQLKAFIAKLYTEAQTKIRSANEQINLGNAEINERTKDAQDFATYIAQMMQGGGVPQGGQPNVMSEVPNGSNGQKG